MCEGRFRMVLKEEKLIPEKYNCRVMMVGHSIEAKKLRQPALEFGPRTTDADLGSVGHGSLLNRVARKEGAKREPRQ